MFPARDISPLLWTTYSDVELFLRWRLLFLNPERICPEATYAHCLFCHWESLWREYLDVLCNYLLGIGKLWLVVLWDVPSLSWTDTIPSAFLHMSSSPTLWPFWGPLWDTLQLSCVSFQLEGIQLDTVFQM